MFSLYMLIGETKLITKYLKKFTVLEKTSRFFASKVATNGDAGGDTQFKLSLAAESMVPQFAPSNFFVCMGTQTALIFFVDTEV